VSPVHRGVTYGYDDLDVWTEVARRQRAGHIYSRNTNPTVAVFEAKLCALEWGEAATSFATGMAAISNTLFALLGEGDRVVSIRDTYGGTNKIFTEWLPRFGIEAVLCETADDAVERGIAGGAKVVYLESPTNPTLKVLNLRRLAEAGHAAGAVVVVDNTFATPINQRPLEFGADLVLHSATKFLGGHSDALGGVACGSAALVQQLFAFREIHGAALHADAAFLLIRGMKTLELRVERHNANAQRSRVSGPAPTSGISLLSRPTLPRRSCNRTIADAGLRWGAVVHAARRARRRSRVPTATSPGPPRGEPGLGEHSGRATIHDQPCRAEPRGAGRGGHPRGAGAVFGGDRERRRLDRRSRRRVVRRERCLSGARRAGCLRSGP